ncbi:MAG TPA: LCP family protein [Anaerolineales bacterium]|nr:LCP family protein [Anaerolineales bacterium]
MREFFARRRWWIIAAVLAVLLVVLAWPGISRSVNRPLGPGLELSTLTPSVPPPATPTRATEAAVAPAPTETSTPAPMCGGPPSMMVLAIGADNRENNYLYGLADVIRVARVDFVTPGISVLSLPRDIWVEIPEISDHYGITHGKLNQAYLYGNPGMGYYDGPGLGPGLLARTLEANFLLRVDHYAAVNMRTFVKIVDAVGGIDIYLEAPVDGRPVDDKTEDMGYFRAGQHHMSGETALRFSRIRKVDNAFKRDDRQTMVLCALKEKLLSPDVLPRVPQIIASLQDSVLTDLSLAQLGQLACLGPQIPPANLRFASLPEELLVGGRNEQGSYVLRADMDAVRALVADFIAGIWPTEPDQPSCP